MISLTYHATSGIGSPLIFMVKKVFPPFWAFLSFKSVMHLGIANSSRATKEKKNIYYQWEWKRVKMLVIFQIGNLVYILLIFLLQELQKKKKYYQWEWKRFKMLGKLSSWQPYIYILLIFFLINEAGVLYEGNGKTRGPFINLFCTAKWFLSIIKLEQRTVVLTYRTESPSDFISMPFMIVTPMKSDSFWRSSLIFMNLFFHEIFVKHWKWDIAKTI